MNKKMKWGGMLFASLLMASSCQNEEIITGEKQGNYSLTVSSLVDSRTYVKDDGTVVWSKGDKLYVYGNNVSGVLTLDDNDAGETKGTFSGFVFGNPDNLKWAVFGDEVKGTTNGAQFTISEISDPNSNSPMVGEIKGGNVDLKHLCGMVRITINNLPKNADVKLVGDDIAGTAEWNGTSMSVKSVSDEIKINVENGYQTIEVPVFAEEAEATKNFKLVVNGKECPFSAPVAIGALSEKAIMHITCIVENGVVTGFTQAATTQESLIQALQTEGTVSFQLSDDITLDKTVVVGAKTTATIDLNGNTLSLGANYIQNKGTLTIENGSLTADTFNDTTNGAPLWNNGGNLTIKDGTTISGICSAVRNESGNTTIEGGTLRATCDLGYSSSIIRMKNGTLTINNGTFIGCADINTIGAEGCSIINPTGGTTTINGGHFSNFSSSPGSIFANALTGVTVKGGTFEFTPVDNWEPEQSFTEKGYLADGYSVIGIGNGKWIIEEGVVVTPSNLATINFNQNAKFLLIGDFSGVNSVSITPTEDVEAVIDGSYATFGNQIKFMIPSVPNNANVVSRENVRKGNYTLTGFNGTALGLGAYGTNISVTSSTLEVIDVYAANISLDINGNNIDADYTMQPRVSGGETDYAVCLMMMAYDLKFDNNVVSNAIGHVVAINGLVGTFDTDRSEINNANWASNVESFTGNTITGIGGSSKTDRAGFKVWDDLSYAHSGENSYEKLPQAGKDLIEYINAESQKNVFEKAVSATNPYKFSFYSYNHGAL